MCSFEPVAKQLKEECETRKKELEATKTSLECEKIKHKQSKLSLKRSKDREEYQGKKVKRKLKNRLTMKVVNMRSCNCNKRSKNFKKR